jgi:hypothetical protein
MIPAVRRTLAAATVLIMAACGGERGRPQAGPSGSPTFEGVTTASPGTIEWLAVFDTAPDPEALQDIQEEILASSPQNVAISQAGCWKQVPAKLHVDEGEYVAGVVAASPRALKQAVDAVGREPIFEGQVTLIACD